MVPIPEEPPVIKTTLLIVAFIGLTKKKILLKEDYLCLNSKIESEIFRLKKWQRPTSPLNHVPLLCSHPGESAGAGRRTCRCKYTIFYIFTSACSVKITLYIGIFKIHTMKNYNVLSVILLAMALSNCGGTKKGENTIFNFDTSSFSAKYT
jgi:hypothetical protein